MLFSVQLVMQYINLLKLSTNCVLKHSIYVHNARYSVSVVSAVVKAARLIVHGTDWGRSRWWVGTGTRLVSSSCFGQNKQSMCYDTSIAILVFKME